MTKIRGKGQLEKLDRNRWRIRVSLGKNPVTGKYQKSPSRIVYGNKSDAINALEAYKSEIRSGNIVDTKNLTVDAYATMFHEQREGATKSPLTFKREAIEIDYIERYFGGYELDELTPAIIRKAYATLRTEKAITESALHKLHQKLSQVMKQAVTDGLVAKNPCESISVPRPQPAERKSLDADEAARLYGILIDSEFSGAVVATMLALSTGMRRGEVLGLMWKNVDFERKAIYVAVQYAADKELRAPKSKKSQRWIGIDDQTVEYLADWRERQAEIFSDLGVNEEGGQLVVQTGDSPVVSNEVGGFYDPNLLARWFRGFCVKNGFGTFGDMEEYTDAAGRKRKHKAGYRGLKFHELRHTQATLLIGNGADIKTVQHRLGHSSASLTMNICAHAAIEANDRVAAEAIGGILGSASK